MQRRVFMTGTAAVLLGGISTRRSTAAGNHAGGAVDVKANSIWFTTAAGLARWQMLAKGGDTQALSSYQEKALKDRDAWQFLDRLTVKVLSHDRAKHRLKVQMTEPGRLDGTIWFLDDASVQQ